MIKSVSLQVLCLRTHILRLGSNSSLMNFISDGSEYMPSKHTYTRYHRLLHLSPRSEQIDRAFAACSIV